MSKDSVLTGRSKFGGKNLLSYGQETRIPSTKLETGKNSAVFKNSLYHILYLIFIYKLEFYNLVAFLAKWFVP